MPIKRSFVTADTQAMGLTVSRYSSTASLDVSALSVNPARLGWGLAMMLAAGSTIFYAVAAPFFSGQRVTTFTLQGSSALELPGITFSRSGPRQELVGPVTLDPAMDPVGLVLHVKHGTISSSERLSCAITARDASGRVVWENERVIASGRTGRGGVGSGNLVAMFGRMSVPAADSYTFEVRFMSQYSDLVRSADLEIRRNVRGPSLTAIGFGVAIALGSFVGFLFAGRTRDKDSSSLPKAA